MNLGILVLCTFGWGALFLQALHISNPMLAPWYFFGSGIFQWLCGLVFVDACAELEQWKKSRDD